MKKTIILAVASFLLCSQLASAQFVGMNSNSSVQSKKSYSAASSFEAKNTFHVNYSPIKLVTTSGSDSESEKYNGFNVGWEHLCPLSTNNLFFEYGLSLAMGFKNEKKSSYEYKTTLMDLRVPFSLSYMLQIPNTSVGIMPVAGLDLGAYVLGKNKFKYGSNDWEESNIFDSDSKNKRFIFDFHVGARLAFGEKFFLEYRYEGPITPIYKEDDYKMTVRRHNVGLGLFF